MRGIEGHLPASTTHIQILLKLTNKNNIVIMNTGEGRGGGRMFRGGMVRTCKITWALEGVKSVLIGGCLTFKHISLQLQKYGVNQNNIMNNKVHKAVF